MIAVAALVLGALQAGASGAVQASFELDPPAVEVGEPVALTLVVRHPSAVRVQAGELEPDESWVLFDASGRATRPDPGAPGRALTTRTFRLASLEPGERELPSVTIAWDQGDVRRQVDVAPAVVSVASVLAPDESGPRPLKGFRDVEDVPRAPLRPLAWAVLGSVGALALASLAFVVAKRRRGAPAEAPAEPSPTAVLATLEPRAEPAAVAAVYSAMTRELRRAASARADVEVPGGATDAEWVAELARVDAELGRRVAAFLRRAEPVKYAAQRPTAFAVREALDEARALAVALERPTANGRTGAGGAP